MQSAGCELFGIVRVSVASTSGIADGESNVGKGDLIGANQH